jgi:hypothetical protein
MYCVDPDAPGEMLSSIPVIIPTLDGRVHGVFWSANATARAGGLIVLSDTNSDRRVLALLQALCQRVGISVLEMSSNRPEASTRVADPGWYARHLLAGVNDLCSRGISDIAIIFCNGGPSSTLSPQDLQDQLLTWCAETIVASSTDRRDLTKRLAAVTDSIGSAADCIRGLTAFTFSAATAPRKMLRLTDTLYNWTIDTLHWHGVDTGSSATRPLPLDSATHSLPGDRRNVRQQTSHLRADISRASNSARQNFIFLQHEWDAMLEDLEQRDGIRAVNLRQQRERVVTSTKEQITTRGDSYDPAMVLRAARDSWRFLDEAARDRWLKAWSQVFPFGGLGKIQTSLPEVSIISPH